MKRLFTLLLLLSSGATLLSPASHAQTINTEAATAYWHLTDGLRRNEPLTDQAWQTFLAIPANRIYARECFTGPDDVARYRRILEQVYRPGADSLVQAKLRANSWYYVLLTDYKQHETEYKQFLAETVAKPAFLEAMYTYAYAYLPARNHTRLPDLKLAYVAIGNDATSQDEGIFFSLRDARDNAVVRPGLLEAHELHHQLRSQKNFGSLAPADAGLLWSLSSALNEGLADLTDKKVLLEESSDSVGVRNWLLRPAPTAIYRIDSTIQVLAAGGPATPERFYRQLTQGSNGHIPGFFMAYTIVRNGYRTSLLDHADDPLAFALLYQQAARKDPHHPPIFSAASVHYLQQLARRYSRPRAIPIATKS